MADKYGIALVGVECAIGFVSEINGRKFGPAIELYRPQQTYLSIQTEACIPLHAICHISGTSLNNNLLSGGGCG